MLNDLSLKYKVSLLLLFSKVLSLGLVGVSLTLFIAHQHETEARERFSEAVQLLAWRLRENEQSLLKRATQLAERQDIVASANMIFEYQSVEDYEPFIFDVEKEKVAGELHRGLQALRTDRDARGAALYDGRGHLESFSVAHQGKYQEGYMSFRNGVPVVLLKGVAGPTPGEVHWLIGAERRSPPPSPVVRYSVRENRLVMEAVAPIVRSVPAGPAKVLGAVGLAEVLGEDFAVSVWKETRTEFAIFVDGRVSAHGPERFDVAPRFDRAPSVFAEDPERSGGWGEEPGHYFQGSLIPTEGGASVQAVFAVATGPVLAQMRRAQAIVLAVLLLSAAIVVPLGIVVAGRTITRPVRRLVDAAQAVKRGEYDYPLDAGSKDEIGRLAQTFKDMTGTIRQREEELMESRASLAEAQRIARLGNWDWDLAAGQFHCSDELRQIFGISPEEIGTDYQFLAAFIHQEDRERVLQAVDGALESGTGCSLDYRVVQPGGAVQVVHEEVGIRGFRDGKPTRVIGTVQIVTELRAVENALRKLNRSLRALSACNEALVHASQEQELLDAVCRILVDVGGYRLAWVGFSEHDSGKSVRPVSRSGDEADYLDRIRISWGDNEWGRGPTGTAIRTGQIQTVQNISTDPAFVPWRAEALRRGYGSSIAVPLVAGRQMYGALNLYARDTNAFDAAEVELLRELSGDLAFGIETLRARRTQEQMEIERAGYVERLERSMEGTIQAIGLALEKRDPYTAGHQRRVADLAVAIASELGLDEDRVKGIKLGAMIHDIGKIYVPAEILSRPGRLTATEFELVKSHCEIGYEIVQGVDFPWPVAQMIVQHHERLDGSGYPGQLRGEAIIVEARILAVADVAEAMCSHRPYRPARGIEAALQELLSMKGTRYDPRAVDACVDLFRSGRFAWRD